MNIKEKRIDIIRDITNEHIRVLVDPDWETAVTIISELRALGLWDDREHMPNQRGRFLVAELREHARKLLLEQFGAVVVCDAGTVTVNGRGYVNDLASDFGFDIGNVNDTAPNCVYDVGLVDA